MDDSICVYPDHSANLESNMYTAKNKGMILKT